MAPAANTGKSRKLALLADSDYESEAYQEKLEEAEAARNRLRKVDHPIPINHAARSVTHPTPPPQAQEDRDKRREALALAYQRSLSGIYSRVEKSIAKYRDLQ
jgi:hypothetical protein